ncbi:MAG: hypothetical protein D3922_11355 [Candidatus Electrothrix sp. AR1]|nr:hypothetical protein [Candidatus Electrothrix sp. AR1]
MYKIYELKWPFLDSLDTSYNPNNDFLAVIDFSIKGEDDRNQVSKEMTGKFKNGDFDAASRFIKKVVAQLGAQTQFYSVLPVILDYLHLTPCHSAMNNGS